MSVYELRCRCIHECHAKGARVKSEAIGGWLGEGGAMYSESRVHLQPMG